MSPPTIPVVSDVKGRTATAGQLCTAEYWVTQLRGAVRFADGVRFLTEEGVTRFLELGPDAVLAAMATDSRAEDAPGVVVPALRRGGDEVVSALAALTQVYVHGGSCDWAAFLPDTAEPAELPTYPFQRQRYWIDAPASEGDVRVRRSAEASATSLSCASAKVWPQKRGKVGKHSEASTWLRSMSASRAAGSQQPRRIWSRVMPSSVISSRVESDGRDVALVRELEVLVDPPVGRRSVGVHGDAVLAADVLQFRRCRRSAVFGPPVPVLGREPGLEQVRRFSITWSSTLMIARQFRHGARPLATRRVAPADI
ncbi:hypothetical protein TPA0909_55170 [Streptomyces albus]|nr:hypothetical protein TPA0909_55170 [Streptomyces albus]